MPQPARKGNADKNTAEITRRFAMYREPLFSKQSIDIDYSGDMHSEENDQHTPCLP
jgi:hypothetical protein